MADWTKQENEATVAAYFVMLEAALRGELVNKAQHNRQLQPLLDGRSKGAVEYKFQNVSAVLIDLGVPYITGYKPAVNYQRDLLLVASAQLEQRRVLRELIAQSVSEVPTATPVANPEEVFVDIPTLRERPTSKSAHPRVRPFVDYVAMEARNIGLGLAGEKFVIDLERTRLERAGQGTLAGRVSHVSVERGDGLGYDILSFEENSKEKLIEVKTTKYGEYTPFYVTKNELEVSRESAENYHLYRVYAFGGSTRLFSLPGAIHENLDLQAANYVARVRYLGD
jgi:hypothetical protein